MVRNVWVYSEQNLTPRAADVIREIKNNAGFEDVKFQFIGDKGHVKNTKVLVFGNALPSDITFDNVEFVHTYSVAQLMTKPNAVTVLTASLNLYFGNKHEPPTNMRPFAASSALPPEWWGFDYTKPVVIDIETDGDLGNTHTPDEVRLISVGLYQPGADPVVYFTNHTEHLGTQRLSNSQIIMLAEELPKFEYAIYHNGKFDIRVLNRELGVKLVNSFDTMLAHHVLNHAAKMHGLKELAQRYFGAPDWEGDIKKYTKGGGHYELIPWAKLVEYNGWDVYWTYQLYELLRPQIEADEDNMKAFMFEMAEADFLLEVEQNGLPFDNAAALNLSLAEAQKMSIAREELKHITHKPDFNPGSWQQVKAWLTEHYGVIPDTSSKTIELILEDWATDVVHTFCEQLLAYRKASKIKGTYADGWKKQARNGRVHPTFLVHGTSTGRLSSTGPNAQNVPRDKRIRSIVALPDRKGSS